MKNWQLKPTLNQTFELVGRGDFDFVSVLRRAEHLQADNRIDEACNERYAAVQRLIDILPDDEDIILEWNDRNSRAALEVTEASARDHLLIGDVEMAAALCEMVLELDPEDHLEALPLAAFCYVALGDYDSFDEIADDLSDKSPEKHILNLWAAFRRTGSLPDGELRIFRERFGEYFDEFVRSDHPADEQYRAEMEKETPSRRTQARHLWLQTEPLWLQNKDFINQLGRFNFE